MAIQKLSNIPDRAQVGIGTMLNPNHEGGLKRSMEDHALENLNNSDIKIKIPSPTANLCMNNPNYKG